MDMKGCIYHFTKWQIHPFISKGTVYGIWIISETKSQCITPCSDLVLRRTSEWLRVKYERRRSTRAWDKFAMHPRNTRHPHNVGSVLVKRRRRLSSIDPTLGVCREAYWHANVILDCCQAFDKVLIAARIIIAPLVAFIWHFRDKFDLDVKAFDWPRLRPRSIRCSSTLNSWNN